MGYAWQSVEEASVTLQISTRTLHRRITKGEVETRLANGRREVLVCLPDEDEGELDQTNEELSDVIENPSESSPQPVEVSTSLILAEKDLQLANERFRRTELALAAFQHTSQILQKEASRTRISARLAWTAVAVLSIGVYIAVGWTASKVTKAKSDNENLAMQLQTLTSTVSDKSAEVEKYRDQMGDAKQAAARMEGELAVAKSTLVTLTAKKKPATQPTFLQWMAGVQMEPGDR